LDTSRDGDSSSLDPDEQLVAAMFRETLRNVIAESKGRASSAGLAGAVAILRADGTFVFWCQADGLDSDDLRQLADSLTRLGTS
jgi:hypothetical protein